MADIGKSTLAESLCQEATERDASVLVGRCYDLTETPPYGLWIDLFARYPHDSSPPPPAAFALRGTVGEVASQTVLIQQVLDFFAALTAVRPMVLLLDDLHWADPASLDVLRALARSLPTLPLLVIATYRSDELTRHQPLYPLLPLLVREARAERLPLDALDDDAICALVTARYALPAPETDRLVACLQARAEGNALFVEEVLRSLEEGGALAREGAAWRLGDLGGATVPALLRQVIDSRVERMDEEAQRLLAVAAVIGQEVPLDVWAAVASADEEMFVEVVEQATAAHLGEATVDGTGFRFAHALVREALYDGILPLRRRALHRQVGEVLAALPHPDPDAVAFHFQRASDARATEWLIRAGERAHHAFAFPIAVARFEAALALMDLAHAGETAERAWLLVRLAIACLRINPRQSVAYADAAARIAATSDDRALDAVADFALGIAHGFVGDSLLCVQRMRQGMAAVDALPLADQQRVAGALNLSADTQRGALILYLAGSGHLREAVTLGEARTPQSLGTGGWYRGLLLAYSFLGQPKRAADAFARACAVERAVHDYFNLGLGHTIHLESLLIYHADDLAGRRRVAEAGEQAWQQACAIIPDFQSPRFAWLPLWLVEGRWEELAQAIPALRTPTANHRWAIASVLGAFARLRGEAAEAWRQVWGVLPQGAATPPGSTGLGAGLEMHRLAVSLALDAGDLPTAREWLEAHGAWLKWSEAVRGQSEDHALWAECW